MCVFVSVCVCLCVCVCACVCVYVEFYHLLIFLDDIAPDKFQKFPGGFGE